MVSLVVTGIAIELVLAPIALYHFHKTGALRRAGQCGGNTVHDLLLIMPAWRQWRCMFDLFGLGAPFWWLAGQGISVILALAHGM